MRMSPTVGYPSEAFEGKIRLALAWTSLTATIGAVVAAAIFIAAGGVGVGVTKIIVNVVAGGTMCMMCLAPMEQIQLLVGGFCQTVCIAIMPLFMAFMSFDAAYFTYRRIRDGFVRTPWEVPGFWSFPTFREGYFAKLSETTVTGWAWTAFAASVISTIGYIIITSAIYRVSAEIKRQMLNERARIAREAAVMPTLDPRTFASPEALERARREGFVYDPNAPPAAYVVNVRGDGTYSPNPHRWLPIPLQPHAGQPQSTSNPPEQTTTAAAEPGTTVQGPVSAPPGPQPANLPPGGSPIIEV